MSRPSWWERDLLSHSHTKTGEAFCFYQHTCFLPTHGKLDQNPIGRYSFAGRKITIGISREVCFL